MGEAAVAVARTAGYRNAGTVEFLARGHRRFRAVLLPRDEHAAPGRASGHRTDHRRRPRARADRESPPASRCRGRRRICRSADTPSRCASTRRIRRRQDLPQAGHAAALPRAVDAGHSRRQRRDGRRRDRGPLRSAARQADRVRRNARRCPSASARRTPQLSDPRHPDQHPAAHRAARASAVRRPATSTRASSTPTATPSGHACRRVPLQRSWPSPPPPAPQDQPPRLAAAPRRAADIDPWSSLRGARV